MQKALIAYQKQQRPFSQKEPFSEANASRLRGITPQMVYLRIESTIAWFLSSIKRAVPGPKTSICSIFGEIYNPMGYLKNGKLNNSPYFSRMPTREEVHKAAKLLRGIKEAYLQNAKPENPRILLDSEVHLLKAFGFQAQIETLAIIHDSSLEKNHPKLAWLNSSLWESLLKNPAAGPMQEFSSLSEELKVCRGLLITGTI